MHVSNPPGFVGSDRHIEKPSQSSAEATDFLEVLWTDEKNRAEVDAFMNNFMCKYWSRAPIKTPPDADVELAILTFHDYAIQDYFYLVDHIKFEALRLTTTDSFDEINRQAKLIAESARYAEDWKQRCIDKLGVTEEELNATERSVAELAYSNYMQNNTLGESFFNLHVITAACTYGWLKLAQKLDEDEKTVKGNFFYENWIQPSLESESAKRLEEFLSKHKQRLTTQEDREKKWNKIFRTALRLEVALFESSLDFFPRNVVSRLREERLPEGW